MSLFEWLGESYNPGPTGTVDVGYRSRPDRSRLAVLVCLVLTLILLGIWVYFILGICQVTSPTGLIGLALGTLLYLVLGYTIHPQPDMSNIGWMGGLMDHPFRYSDDVNRFLIFLVIFLWPGRFMAESIVDTGSLLMHVREHEKPRRRRV